MYRTYILERRVKYLSLIKCINVDKVKIFNILTRIIVKLLIVLFTLITLIN